MIVTVYPVLRGHTKVPDTCKFSMPGAGADPHGFHRFTEIGQIFQNGSGNHEVNFKS